MGRWLVAALAAMAVHAAAVSAQTLDATEQEAGALFERGDYAGAVRALDRAAGRDSLDASYYYHRGYYTHYACYDSRPLAGCDSLSDRVIDDLKRAAALDPGMGDAFYFIGAERGGRARSAMGRGDWGLARAELRAARGEGAFPDWLVEYGRNTLRSCAPEAILFAGGDAEVNPIEYLQLIEGERPDVTLVPVALLDVPWFAMLLKRGAPGALRAAPIEWTDEQIYGMRPYKWKSNPVEIPASAEAHDPWTVTVEPDLTGGSNTFLSASSALLLHILEVNRGRRPVQFTLGCPQAKTEPFAPSLAIVGLTRRLLPGAAPAPIDTAATAALFLDPASYRDLPGVLVHDMPRVSPILQNYRAVLMQLASSRAAAGDARGAISALDAVTRLVPEDAVPMPPPLRQGIEQMRKALGS